MSSASIETTLELWASSLRDVKARMRPLFGDGRVAASANQFLDGLLSDERRKTGWMRAKRQVILDLGDSRRFWGAVTGMPRLWSALCVTMSWNTWLTPMRCW
jgi:hypothetical protein